MGNQVRVRRFHLGRRALGLIALLAGTGVALAASHEKRITTYEGSQSCTRCHTRAASEVMATTHWTWDYTDPKTGQKLGKKNVINNYCIAVGSNEPRCTSCHVGLGYADKTFDFADATKVDCLICHDTTGTYKKFPTGAGHPVYETPKEFPAGSGILWPPPDLTLAKNVGPTSRATCGACHFFGGGGDAVKHGDLDSTLTNPKRDVDVHMGVDGMNFSCSDCHAPDDHQIPGSIYPGVPAEHRLKCEECHTANPHQTGSVKDRLNAHTGRVACQTCHIPHFAAGGKATKMWWDWSKAGQKTPEGKNFVIKDAQGNPIYDTQKGEFRWEANVVPEYKWYNGEMSYISLDEVFDPTQIVAINRVQGSEAEAQAKIYPVKRFGGIQPYDAAAKKLVVPHLFGSDAAAYWKSYDWQKSIAAGMAYVEKPYSGELGFVQTEMYWIQNHMVAPKEKALRCDDCHVPGGRLNFAALGYPAERATSLQNLAAFAIGSMGLTPDGAKLELRWQGTPGRRYQVQQSQNLAQWEDVAGGPMDAGAAAAELSWQGPVDATMRFYRILRTSQ